MRPTRLGLGCLLMAVLALLSAMSTGNNLLYLLYSALLAVLVVSAVAGRLNLLRLSARAEFDAPVFRATDFSLRIEVENKGLWPSYGAALCWGGRSTPPQSLSAGGRTGYELRARFPRRGLNQVEGLILESAFPFGLILHRREVRGLSGLALPRLREVHATAEIKADARASGRPTLRKGSGEELYGIREYVPGDEARSINWKLTAKTGRALVNEFSELQDEKVTVRLDRAGAGEEAERRIEEAASACRFYIDSGAEVKLVTPEEELDYGKGLLHLDRLLEALARLGDGKFPRPAGSPPPPRRPAVKDGPALRDLTFILGALVYAAVFLIDDINPWVLAALSPVFPLAWHLRRRGGAGLPRAAWNALSLAVLAYVVLIDWRSAGVTIANTHLLIYLLANRVLSEVPAEELTQTFLVFFLAFFLVSGLTISLWYFVFFLAYLALAGAWLMLAAGLPFSRRPALAPALAALFGAALVLSGAGFAATPRVEGFRRINPFLAAGIDKLSVKASSVMGFTENVSLGFWGELKKSSARVMRVKPSLAAGQREPALYVRGSAFDVFDGRRWYKYPEDFRYRLGPRLLRSSAGRGWALRRAGGLYFPAAPVGRSSQSYDFVVYPMGITVLFTVGTPWLVEGLDDAVTFDHADSLHVSTPYMGGLRYKLYSNSGPVGFSAEEPGYEATMLARSLKLPPLGSRVRELAMRVTAGAPDAAAKARKIEAYLRKSYSYSTFSDGKGRSIEDFLFSTRRGNCEYFATAGVVLMRAAGVPARLATGFLADDWNEYGKFYDVRQDEAHAWVEAYLPGRGWTRFDPTPGQGGFSASAEALGEKLSKWFNAVQLEWYRSVIGYDQYVQHNTFRRLGLVVSSDALERWAKRGAALSLLLGAALWAFLGLRGLLKLRGAKAAGYYLRAQAALERAGLPREKYLTPREHARRVAEKRPELKLFRALAELHYLQYYSPRGLSSEQEDEARRLFEDIRAKI